MRFHRYALLFTLALPFVARAQSTDTLSLTGRTNLMLGIGLTGTREANASVGRASAHASGELGSFAFNHWVRPEVGITIATSILRADVTATGGAVHTNAVTPILFGITYSPR